MKNAFLITSLIFLFVCYSCADNKPKVDSAEMQNQTPDVLDDAKPGISSVSKRYTSGMVEDLFIEAMNKDDSLKAIVNEMNEMNNTKNDSLRAIKTYFQNNDMYWISANNYIDKLSDTLLKNDLREIFKSLETKYKKSTANHNYVVDNLENKAIVLRDCEIIMKLTISAQMMDNYQKNKLPALNGLKSLVVSYDTLINKTKEYSTIAK
jgi:hypothetical protein